jgi:tetratricopeptide (TPR) repeat protein
MAEALDSLKQRQGAAAAAARWAARASLVAASLLLDGCPVPDRYSAPPPTPNWPRASTPRPPSPSTPRAGGAAAPGTSGAAPGTAPAPDGGDGSRPPRDIQLSAATRSLVTQAHVQTAKGDVDGASATLDRALRIDPTNALLWIELGRLRLMEKDPRQAESCGRKALALASGDARAQALSRQLLMDALRAQGRNPEAVP